ncbi:MAG: GTP-binding protein [Burkholderiales bacterium]
MTPVHILTGYLGSGKTTLLSRLLREPALADTAVIVNELGEVGLDHVLVDRGSEDDVVLLDSGCLCCALGNSLQETLESLHYRRARNELPDFTRVVIETTGVADPGPIAATLGLDSAIARHYRLGSIVTVVDAIHGIAHLDRFEEARRQAALADAIVMSKLDLVGEVPEALDLRLAALNPHARRARARDLLLFDDDAMPRALPPLDHDGHDHDDHRDHDHLAEQGIVTRAIRLDAPLDWPRYAAWVQWMQKTLGPALLRMKGVVRMDDGGVLALHAVMQLFAAPVPLATMPAELGLGVVVVIAQDVSPDVLDEARRRLAQPLEVA